MKICFVGVFPEKPGQVKGGVANVISYLAAELAVRNHEIHIVCPSDKNQLSLDWYPIKVHYVAIPTFFPRVFINPTLLRHKINAKISEIDPDICHFHGTATYSLNCPFPCILTLHGVPEKDVVFSPGYFSRLKSYLQGRIERFCRKRAENIIVISKYISDQLGHDIKGDTWLIENPVATLFFNEGRNESVNLFYAGMLNKRKNILGLLKAFEHALKKRPDLILNIAGPDKDSKYVNECCDFIQNNNLGYKVNFLGSLDTKEIGEQLAQSACLVLLSFQETAPLIISESLAAGVPVVASDVGGAKYMINGKVGHVVSPRDPVEAGNAIVDMLSRNQLELAELAKDEATKRFHIDSVISKTLEAYSSVISKSS